MISYVKGVIAFKTPTYVVIEAGGIGYHINITLQTYTRIHELEQAKLLTYFHVREDQQVLYGFSEDAERQLFVKLISVSGIGPSTATALLSTMTVDEAISAIIGEDANAFKKVKGIGPKTAKRMFIELKDKLLKDGGSSNIPLTSVNNTLRDEALSALVALGFNKIHVQKTLNKVLRENKLITDIETLIKTALQNLSS